MEDNGQNKRTQRINKKSVYLNYLVNGPGYVKMSSLTREIARENKLEKHAEEKEFGNKATFTITPANTNLSIQRSLTCITDIEKQDLFKWKAEFLETRKICNWDEATSISVLESTTNTIYLQNMRQESTLEEKINSLFRLKYPIHRSFALAQDLANIKQEQFHTIENFTKKNRLPS